MKIRSINKDEIFESTDVFRRSFTDSEGEVEGNLIAKLANDLLISTAEPDIQTFIAEIDNRIVAVAIFSRIQLATVNNQTPPSCFILSPLAVLPEYQKQGIGKALIEHAKTVLIEQEIDLIVTYGDPNYYQHSGFQAISTQQIPSPLPLSMPHGWLAQSLAPNLTLDVNELIDNESKKAINLSKAFCVPALNQPELW